MFGKINHLAIMSQNYALTAKFYEVIFGMTTSRKARGDRAVTVGDGYVGLNINPRNVARPARLDHFGIEVPDVEAAFARMRSKAPRVEILKRPDTRPYAGVTTHDPDGNVFDLSQKNMSNRADLYAEEEPLHEQYVSHFALRTMNAPEIAQFYVDCFELEPLPKAEGDVNHYLSDGHLTFVVIPWHITDYDGTGIVSPALDHIGFTVPNLERFKERVAEVAARNRQLTPYPVGAGPEGRARLELARRSCPLCAHHLADLEGVLLSASERTGAEGTRPHRAANESRHAS